MDLGCLKGRIAPRAGENDADDRRTTASMHGATSARLRTIAPLACLIRQAVKLCTTLTHAEVSAKIADYSGKDDPARFNFAMVAVGRQHDDGLGWRRPVDGQVARLPVQLDVRAGYFDVAADQRNVVLRPPMRRRSDFLQRRPT